MTGKLHFAGAEVKAVVDPGPSASVVGKCLACKLGMWKRARKVKVRQGDGSYLVGNFVANTLFKVMYSLLVLGQCTMDVQVLYIGSRNVILELV